MHEVCNISQQYEFFFMELKCYFIFYHAPCNTLINIRNAQHPAPKETCAYVAEMKNNKN